MKINSYLTDNHGAGLYIHIPFCRSKCHYCDFYSTPAGLSSELMSSYVDALIREYHFRRNESSAFALPHPTIYIGGGTPSMLPLTELERLLNAIDTSQSIETTIELNPDDVTPTLAQFIAQSPINRVSLGIQTLNDQSLHQLGRTHTSAQAIQSVELLQEAGISNINVDVMFGLPDQSPRQFEQTLSAMFDLKPQHISAYSLMIEQGTRIYASMIAGKFRPTDPAIQQQMYAHLCQVAEQNGFNHYEISNFALPNHFSRHNSSYWTGKPYLGIGAAAHSFDGINTRRAGAPTIKSYLEDNLKASQTETLSAVQQIEEYIMLRLRTSQGFSLTEFENLFGNKATDELRKKISRQISLQPESHLIHDTLRNRVYINPRHWLISDSIILNLI